MARRRSEPRRATAGSGPRGRCRGRFGGAGGGAPRRRRRRGCRQCGRLRRRQLASVGALRPRRAGRREADDEATTVAARRERVDPFATSRAALLASFRAGRSRSSSAASASASRRACAFVRRRARTPAPRVARARSSERRLRRQRRPSSASHSSPWIVALVCILRDRPLDDGLELRRIRGDTEDGAGAGSVLGSRGASPNPRPAEGCVPVVSS